MLAALITEVRIVTVLRGPVSMIICVVVKPLSVLCCPILLAIDTDAAVQRDAYVVCRNVLESVTPSAPSSKQH